MVFYLVVMIRYSLLLTLVGIASILINMFMSRIISKKRVNITRVSMRDSGKLAGATVAVMLLLKPLTPFMPILIKVFTPYLSINL